MTRRVRPTRFSGALGVREFRLLAVAQLVSVTGDQLARVALAVLVFERTSSAALTALTYAVTLLPAIVGGPLLAGSADRYPRRAVMVGCDLARASLVAAMAVPGVPLGVLYGLMFAVVMLASPYSAARVALLADVLPAGRLTAGLALSTVLHQTALLAGFAAGGAIVAATSPRGALGLDAVSFVLSAVLVRFGTRRRVGAVAASGRALWTGTSSGVRLIWQNRTLRRLVGLSWLAGLYVAPEGLAAPYAQQLSAGPAAVGLLMAADPAGMVIGAFAVGRLSSAWRARLTAPLAAGTGIPLVMCATHPGLGVVMILWAVAGACSAYQILAQSAFVEAVPQAGRGQAVGLAASGLVAVQGMGVAFAGVLADWIGPAGTVALAGLTGLVLAAPAVARPLSHQPQILSRTRSTSSRRPAPPEDPSPARHQCRGQGDTT